MKAVPVAGAGMKPAPQRDLRRKTAIWARVTLLPGQYPPPKQPPVTPLWKRFSMNG